MQTPDRLIHTKLHLPFTRAGLVSRPRLQAQIAAGLCGPLTLITAPAGFGKTTLVASCIACCGMPFAWLSLDKDDNQAGRFLGYLIAALREADHTVGSEAAQLLAASQQAPLETILTRLINDLDAAEGEIALVLDDYQFISSPAVHEQVSFLLEHCPNTLHLVIATRSDPQLPLARLRARGHLVELRAADLSFTEAEAAQFLNDVMGLRLEAGAVAVLKDRTEGWVAGLQMASIALQSHLSMRDRQDVLGFIEGFSGTNRYILDYLLEEVLAGQPPEIQRFLLSTSILESLAAPLCDAILKDKGKSIQAEAAESSAVLDYLERVNLFLVPLDDERQWYRYHHLFADLLRTQLQKSIGEQGIARLHLRAAEWYAQNGLILDAIQHASMASNDEMVERLIEQNYLQMMNRGEMSLVRFWMSKLKKELVYRRPWLCLYEAMNRSWFGQLDEATLLLNEAEKRILAKTPAEVSASSAQSMLGYHAYVKSRVTAMQGDNGLAIEFCRTARRRVPADNLALQIDFSITLGYEYFLHGDFLNATQILNESIELGLNAGAVNNPVAAYAILARIQYYQGRLHEAYDLIQKAARLTQESGGQYLGAIGLVELGTAALLCEWNDTESALAHLKKSLDLLPLWGKADDLCLAYIALARIQHARGDHAEAVSAVEKAARLIQTCGVFSEARSIVETARVNVWLARGDKVSVDRWAAALETRLGSPDPFRYEDELAHLAQARRLTAQHKLDEALRLLSCLEENARSSGRLGRLIEILFLKALAKQKAGDTRLAASSLASSLALAEPGGYVRIFLDEGQPMQALLTQWLGHASPGPTQDYAVQLLAQFEAEPSVVTAAQIVTPPAGAVRGTAAHPATATLIEPLSPREVEVLQLLALGKTNQEIARQLFISPGTVKAHTASIYRKLDVANRTEAASLARQLGLLP